MRKISRSNQTQNTSGHSVGELEEWWCLGPCLGRAHPFHQTRCQNVTGFAISYTNIYKYSRSLLWPFSYHKPFEPWKEKESGKTLLLVTECAKWKNQDFTTLGRCTLQVSRAAYVERESESSAAIDSTCCDPSNRNAFRLLWDCSHQPWAIRLCRTPAQNDLARNKVLRLLQHNSDFSPCLVTP